MSPFFFYSPYICWKTELSVHLEMSIHCLIPFNDSLSCINKAEITSMAYKDLTILSNDFNICPCLVFIFYIPVILRTADNLFTTSMLLLSHQPLVCIPLSHWIMHLSWNVLTDICTCPSWEAHTYFSIPSLGISL